MDASWIVYQHCRRRREEQYAKRLEKEKKQTKQKQQKDQKKQNKDNKEVIMFFTANPFLWLSRIKSSQTIQIASIWYFDSTGINDRRSALQIFFLLLQILSNSNIHFIQYRADDKFLDLGEIW